MPEPPLILRVAVPSPLRRVFDYLPPKKCQITDWPVGIRLRVPFGRTRMIGVLVGVATQSDIPRDRLKAVIEVLDHEPLLPKDILALLEWSSGYYHHPLGEVIETALPVALRQGRPAEIRGESTWGLTGTGRQGDVATLQHAPRQAGLIQALREAAAGLKAEQLDRTFQAWRPAMSRLVEKGWVELVQAPCLGREEAARESPPRLNADQAAAVTAVTETLGSYQAFVLDGITGSGKTEVYLALAEQVLAGGGQVLVLVPEIGLAPQIVARFQQRFALPIAVLHSGLSDQERLCAWLMARSGEAPIVIGTRSAVFTPLLTPGLIIVDEEHDPSFKQQEGFRYSARDIAVIRARNHRIPIVLGTATPSLESTYNIQQARYRQLRLTRRAGSAQLPRISLLDVRGQTLHGGLSAPLLKAMEAHLVRGEQVLLFLNRRGYAPTLLCHECGWVADCKRCDAHLILHRRRQRLCCHHCGAERPVERQCPACGSADLVSVGQGTERVESVLRERFPSIGIARVDRDTTRRKGSLQNLLDGIQDGTSQLLIGTQMLAKGHHFPNVTLVGILEAEQGLYSSDFRAGERMAQLIMQVAGRAGRAEQPGQVLVQTHHPDHPLLWSLIQGDYPGIAGALLEERRQAELPPCSAMALLRAEAAQEVPAMHFLEQVRDEALALKIRGAQILGPVPAPMERRAGRYRVQLLMQAGKRQALHRLLDQLLPLIEKLPSARKVRWSLDVDPVDTY
ncbi:MAG: primosomal protein N' [Gammaproteobacteria bacterium RBG_16_57_12]|nr:MAG: primosomal protein N' [Gammaproteobacteria bacterium RBG_16_57_12]